MTSVQNRSMFFISTALKLTSRVVGEPHLRRDFGQHRLVKLGTAGRRSAP
jgi:hypothetical protein